VANALTNHGGCLPESGPQPKICSKEKSNFPCRE
jgi:hypothetical protein